MTIVFKPTSEEFKHLKPLFGQPVSLNVTEIGLSNKALEVKVDTYILMKNLTYVCIILKEMKMLNIIIYLKIRYLILQL